MEAGEGASGEARPGQAAAAARMPAAPPANHAGTDLALGADPLAALFPTSGLLLNVEGVATEPAAAGNPGALPAEAAGVGPALGQPAESSTAVELAGQADRGSGQAAAAGGGTSGLARPAEGSSVGAGPPGLPADHAGAAALATAAADEPLGLPREGDPDPARDPAAPGGARALAAPGELPPLLPAPGGGLGAAGPLAASDRASSWGSFGGAVSPAFSGAGSAAGAWQAADCHALADVPSTPRHEGSGSEDYDAWLHTNGVPSGLANGHAPLQPVAMYAGPPAQVAAAPASSVAMVEAGSICIPDLTFMLSDTL